MDSVTKSALLLNAVRASYSVFKKLCSDYGSEELWSRGSKDSFWKELGLTERMCERLSDFLFQGWAEREEDNIERFNARFITANDIDYPVKLLSLDKPPVGLYVKGWVNLLLPSAAIVGTRKCSDYARATAYNLGYKLALNNVMTVSGGARGIDSAGHRGTLSGNGSTVVVFGTGLDKTYPAENRDLFARILERGAWVSEYHFGTDGNAWRFPERDRLIAALSSWVVVGESPEDGGAMHTARTGKKLGRDTWSIPGRITDEVSRGTNLLIREGANIFISIDDFIRSIVKGNEQLGFDFDDSVNAEVSEAPELSDEEKKVYSVIQKKGSIMIDEVILESGLDFMDVQMAVTNLEAEGLISGSGGRYSAEH